MMSIPRRGSAFTLIEVLASVALSSLLLTSILLVATSAKRSEMMIDRKAVTDDRGADIVELLRSDLLHAHRFIFEDSRMALDGYASLDAQTSTTWHRPAIVTYGMAAVGGRSALVRLEEPPDAPASIRLVAMDVAALEFTPEPVPSPVDGEEWRPEAVRVRLVLTDAAKIREKTIERWIHLP